MDRCGAGAGARHGTKGNGHRSSDTSMKDLVQPEAWRFLAGFDEPDGKKRKLMNW